MAQSYRVAVVGVGNLLLKDEGIGVHVVRALQEAGVPDSVVVIDGGTSPDVLDYLEPANKLVIIDAAEADGAPGTIYRFRLDDLTTDSGRSISHHELSVISSLKMLELSGWQPQEIVIIGVQPKEIDWGMELSPELQEKVPEIVSAVRKEIGKTDSE